MKRAQAYRVNGDSGRDAPEIARLFVTAEKKKRTFTLESFCKWTWTQTIPLKRYRSHFVPSDLRKFAEQWGDVVG
jgi:hypothetical protein